MRMLALAVFAIGAVALFGTGQSRAVPASGSTIAAGSGEVSNVVKAWCTRWHYRGTWGGLNHYRRWCH
jgi:hypothetical protein